MTWVVIYTEREREREREEYHVYLKHQTQEEEQEKGLIKPLEEMEEELILATKIILSLFLGGLVVLLLHLYYSLLVKPKKLRSRLQEEGINGHSLSFLLGNIPDMKRIKLKVQAAPKENHNNVVPIAHDWPSTNFPYFDQWRKEYGTFFIFILFL